MISWYIYIYILIYICLIMFIIYHTSAIKKTSRQTEQTGFTVHISPWGKIAIWWVPCDAEIIEILLGVLFRLRWLLPKTFFLFCKMRVNYCAAHQIFMDLFFWKLRFAPHRVTMCIFFLDLRHIISSTKEKVPLFFASSTYHITH